MEVFTVMEVRAQIPPNMLILFHFEIHRNMGARCSQNVISFGLYMLLSASKDPPPVAHCNYVILKKRSSSLL